MDYENLLKMAEDASKNAYAKYSNFAVGAAILGETGNVYIGCNVENSSYGLTICAERNAIANAIVNGEKHIKAVAIYSPNMQDCLPCGACRQVIYEFQGEKPVEVITRSNDGCKISVIDKLLPEGFNL